jgi:hypothetical protein
MVTEIHIHNFSFIMQDVSEAENIITHVVSWYVTLDLFLVNLLYYYQWRLVTFLAGWADILTIPPPPGGTAILPEYIHYYGYYYQVIVQCLST